MNFLGHSLFSDPTPEAMVGSLWPDFGTRVQAEAANPACVPFFDRHQQIDQITDSHALLEPLRQELRPIFRKTAPVALDMLLDHHLAKHWSRYHPEPLHLHSARVYRLCYEFPEASRPARFTRLLHFMARDNWLVSYAEPEGVVQAMQGLSRRIRFKTPLAEQAPEAVRIENTHSAAIQSFITQLQSEFPITDHG